MNVGNLLLVLALLCFLAATVGLAAGQHLNLVALGLAFMTLGILLRRPEP